MLEEFHVRNFKNFQDELIFSLKTDKNYEFSNQAISDGIIKDSVVLGYNAAGKTNLGYAIMDIVSHLTDNSVSKRSRILYTNLYSEENTASFYYRFCFQKHQLEYIYVKTDSASIVRESISIDGKAIIENSNRDIFTKLKGTENINIENVKENLSFVKYIYANSILDDSDVNCHVFRQFMEYVNGMLMFSSTEGLKYNGFTNERGSITKAICNQKKGVERLEKFLDSVDIKYKLFQKDAGEGEDDIFCKMGDKPVLFSSLLSSGTKSLCFFFYWYMQRENISFVYIDEFDAFYHTDLSIGVLEYLIKEEFLQAVLSTHNTDIISNELLRPDCYFILKDNKIESFNHKTNKALREAHNLQKMYKAGAFNGEE